MYNDQEIPIDYIEARLAFTNAPVLDYKARREARRDKEEDRRNTQFHFMKADMYNESECSFNQMLKSEDIPNEYEHGLQQMVGDFKKKSEYLLGIKQKNKNQTKEETETFEVHQQFANSTENYGNIPLPLLLKIKKGILYIPSLYRITLGLAIAIKENFKNLSNVHNLQLHKAILQKNNMQDPTFAQVLEGFRTRDEFISLTSECNEIGDLATEQICHMISTPNENPMGADMPDLIPVKPKLPLLQELKLINSKCPPRSMEKIIDSIKQSVTLQKLSLQKMDLSER